MYYLSIHMLVSKFLKFCIRDLFEIFFFWKYVQAEHKFWDCIQGLFAINIKYSDGLIF